MSDRYYKWLDPANAALEPWDGDMDSGGTP